MLARFPLLARVSAGHGAALADNYSMADLDEAQATIAALQAGLDRANSRIREQDLIVGTLNARLGAANDRADKLETALMRLQAEHSMWGVPTVPDRPQNRVALRPATISRVASGARCSLSYTTARTRLMPAGQHCGVQ